MFNQSRLLDNPFSLVNVKTQNSFSKNKPNLIKVLDNSSMITNSKSNFGMYFYSISIQMNHKKQVTQSIPNNKYLKSLQYITLSFL